MERHHQRTARRGEAEPNEATVRRRAGTTSGATGARDDGPLRHPRLPPHARNAYGPRALRRAAWHHHRLDGRASHRAARRAALQGHALDIAPDLACGIPGTRRRRDVGRQAASGMERTNGMTFCTCGRPAVSAGLALTCATSMEGARMCASCWRREFAWERVQRASADYNAAIADYVLNPVPSRDVKLLIALHHAKRAYQEARAANEAARA